jgi:hypothetical protein
MAHSAVKYAVMFVCTLPVLLCSGCANNFSSDRIIANVFLVSDAPRPGSLPLEEPVTVYVEGNVLADQVIAAPVKREAPPASFRPVAEIGLKWGWAHGYYTNYLDPKYLHPLIVERARWNARHLGCDSIVIKKNIEPMTEMGLSHDQLLSARMGIPGWDLTPRTKYSMLVVTFIAGSTR